MPAFFIWTCLLCCVLVANYQYVRAEVAGVALGVRGLVGRRWILPPAGVPARAGIEAGIA
jgi:hypothetical protein